MSKQATQSATVPMLPSSGGKHLASAQSQSCSCPLQPPAQPTVAYAEQQRAASAFKPLTFLTGGKCGMSTDTTVALGKPSLSEHSELQLYSRCGASRLSSPKWTQGMNIPLTPHLLTTPPPPTPPSFMKTPLFSNLHFSYVIYSNDGQQCFFA